MSLNDGCGEMLVVVAAATAVETGMPGSGPWGLGPEVAPPVVSHPRRPLSYRAAERAMDIHGENEIAS
eukprot:8835213-Pyramimonas_sp.AAC.1